MKVLITGGYGFIGSHVADRFYKEGYEVYIIDDFSTGRRDRVACKHKSYDLSVVDTACEEVFRSFPFDVVVHLAAQASVPASVKDPKADAEANVLGLVNMLTLSEKYKVSKFLFASTAAVYGTRARLPLKEGEAANPISPYGMSKWTGELYCAKWRQLYGLDTVCFRFSNVYGPRQGSDGEAGVVAKFHSNLLVDQPLNIFGDGEQTRDFIYVEDVADALFRASHSDLTGVYNLSTNTETTVNALANTLISLHGSGGVEYLPKRDEDIQRSSLSNEKLRNHLDWAPLYDLEEGLKRTYTYFQAQQEKEEKKEARQKGNFLSSVAFKTAKPYIENLLAFFVIAFFFVNGNLGMQQSVGVAIVIYIVVLGILYGKRQAVLAAGLSILLMLYDRLADGREFISLLYDTAFLFQSIIYLFTALVTGYAVQRKNNMILAQKEQVQRLEVKYALLNEVHEDVLEVKNALRRRILTDEDSFGKVHTLLKELDGFDPETVHMQTVQVVQKVMHAKEVSFLMLSGNRQHARQLARSGQRVGRSAIPMKVADHAFLRHILEKGSLFVNKGLDASAPMMAAPIRHNGKIVAVVCVKGLGFDQMTLYMENVLTIVADMAGTALSRAMKFEEARAGGGG
ncbi:NAD-dependent epimerase/dehydratase family protein [Sporosarcina koreensis]|uniref:NAD-dependent epimerase/dehydratase family protein n=1 Tax=Sporosarcina koreensis TaxID=334735 RepID=A0ABW0TZ09_9BACL